MKSPHSDVRRSQIKKRSPGSRSVLKLLPVSEEMKAFSAALAKQIQSWPNVRTRPMFGFVSYYRGSSIFAALPRSRSWLTPNSFMFKLSPPDQQLRARLASEPCIDLSESGKWFPFEVRSEHDLNRALDWLSLAYENAGTKRNTGRRPRTA